MNIINLKATTAAKILLAPLTSLYARALRCRRWIYRYYPQWQKTFSVPVISVGNLSFGGTGKSPLTLYLAQKIEAMGQRPLLLTRGYKGRLEQHHGLLKAQHAFQYDAEKFGDEAVMLAQGLQHGAVVVGKKRSANLQFYFPQIHPDAVILDDGYQHLKIFRHLNIVLFDGQLPLSQLRPAPLGQLREGLEALADADVVVISKISSMSEGEAAIQVQKLRTFLSPYVPHHALWCQMYLAPTELRAAKAHHAVELTHLAGKKIFAVAAVASPQSFFQTLLDFGVQLVGRKVFPDHHPYTQEEIQEILSQAREMEALVVMTEKDVVKVRSMVGAQEVYYLHVQAQFLQGEAELLQKVQKLLSRGKGISDSTREI